MRSPPRALSRQSRRNLWRSPPRKPAAGFAPRPYNAKGGRTRSSSSSTCLRRRRRRRTTLSRNVRTRPPSCPGFQRPMYGSWKMNLHPSKRTLFDEIGGRVRGRAVFEVARVRFPPMWICPAVGFPSRPTSSAPSVRSLPKPGNSPTRSRTLSPFPPGEPLQPPRHARRRLGPSKKRLPEKPSIPNKLSPLRRRLAWSRGGRPSRFPSAARAASEPPSRIFRSDGREMPRAGASTARRIHEPREPVPGERRRGPATPCCSLGANVGSFRRQTKRGGVSLLVCGDGAPIDRRELRPGPFRASSSEAANTPIDTDECSGERSSSRPPAATLAFEPCP